MHFISSSPKETEKIGFTLSKKIKDNKIILLIGEIGSGKTTFVKGFAKGLKVKEIVSSPSFVIMNIYFGKKKIYHLDLYRINSLKEIEFIYDFIRDGIIIVEWGEKIKNEFGKNAIIVSFKIINKKKREIVINDNSD